MALSNATSVTSWPLSKSAQAIETKHASAPAIELSGVNQRYLKNDRNTLIIEHLSIERGERVALVGASGAGKSTLLNLIAGRLNGWTGDINVLGRQLDPDCKPGRDWRVEVGRVFQEYALVERATVLENVRNGRLGRTRLVSSLFGLFSQRDREATEAAMEDVQIDELAYKTVDELSGGQRQRVAIARCLAQEPSLLLADEPVSSLDPVNAAAILKLLSDSALQRGATLVVSSHQPRLVAGFVDRFVALDRGRVAFDGPPEDLPEEKLVSIYQASSNAVINDGPSEA